MKCENSFCIYQSKGKCMLDEVEIDDLGMCTECIVPDIDEEILNQAKEKGLKNMIVRQCSWSCAVIQANIRFHSQ